MKRFCWIVLLIPALVFGCLTDSDSGKEEEKKGGSGQKKITFNYTGELKLFEFQTVKFVMTVTPAPDPNEKILFMIYRGTDIADEFLLPGQQITTVHNFGGLRAGDSKIFVAIVDSLEYIALQELAPWHGSATLEIKVRKITIDITAVPGTPPQNIVFSVNSPEQSWIPSGAEYSWDFGDGITEAVEGSPTITHKFSRSGEFLVQLSLKALREADATEKTVIVTDTLRVTVPRDILEGFEPAISPDDTTWIPNSNITFQVSAGLSRTDYPNQVRWVVDFGDGSSTEYTKYIDPWSFQHWYKDIGNYLLQATAYDPSTGKVLGHDSASVLISNLPLLRKMSSVYLHVKGYTVRHDGVRDSSGKFTETGVSPNLWGFGNLAFNLAWNGGKFTANGKVGDAQSWTMTGAVSAIGDRVDSLVYVETYQSPSNGGLWKWENRVTVRDVPFTYITPTLSQFQKEGAAVGTYVTRFESWESIVTPSSNIYRYFSPFDWQNTSMGTPILKVEFK